MKRAEILVNFMKGRTCLHDLFKVKEREWSGLDVSDFRNDTTTNPFLCAELLFCPDPCYGRKSEGSVATRKDQLNDPGNPCRKLKEPTCKWIHDRNLNFDALQRNRFNISCNCQAEKPGFEWNSRFHLCVDRDECRDKVVTCTHGKLCQNLAGSYACTCRRGHRFDQRRAKCVEHVPLPAHTYSRPRTVKAKKHNSMLVVLVA
ncbi:fibrillin-1 [Aplysia californica]|uniref:Fibrillin-1 n=1 Tax=Aplysia californica TaxID=6500 RepID=A0ABM1A9U8_APLCA|nr:fibrillin-1 [Aplysia californica]